MKSMMQKQWEQNKYKWSKQLVFEKISRIDQPLCKLTKKQGENIQIHNQKKNVDTKRPQGNPEYYKDILKKLYFTKLENVREMDNFLG